MTSTRPDAELPEDAQILHPLTPQPYNLTPSRRRDLFGGHGEVKVWNLLNPRAIDPFRAALWCELEASGIVGRHVQQHYPEILLCLSGEGVVTIGAHRHTFIAGVCLTLPLGEILHISCGADAPLSYLIIKAEK
jgi:mannose-6-phosphate isomerase-like protein (cupin superfamily)